MRITVLLGGHLSTEAVEGPQERVLEVPPNSRVEDLFSALGLPLQRIGMILLNGKGATPDHELQDGDRVGLFPPELRYNTFVSMYFRPEHIRARDRKEEN